MRSLAASERQIFWMLRLPNALPFVMAGLDVAMIFALIGAIVGEFVGAKHGLGMLIQSMNFTMDVSGQFSVLLILSIVGLILNRLHLAHPKAGPLLGPIRERESETHEESIAAAVTLCSPLLAGAARRPPPRRRPRCAVGWCSRTISGAATPFAIATRMGWFKADGIEVELVPLPGSGDCVKNVATREC